MVIGKIIPKRYKKGGKYNGTLYLDAKSMEKCRKEINYSDRAIKIYVEGISKPALKNKKFISGIFKGHLTLVVLNYCATQYSENELVSNFNLKRESSIRNLKKFSGELAQYTSKNLWNPKIGSEFQERRRYSYENFTDPHFRHVTWNIDEKSIKTPKFKRNDDEGNKLDSYELDEYYYDNNLKSPGKRFVILRSSDNKWRGCSKSCYPSGKFQGGKIVKIDPFCRNWFSLMNEGDCVSANTEIGLSIKSLLKGSDEHCHNPAIDETRVVYPPKINNSYNDEIKQRIEKIKRMHNIFGKKNIKKAFRVLVNNNPGILNKLNSFRTDNGIFLSNLIQVAMEMQNIEESLTEEEREIEEKEFLMNLYNGEVEFNERDIPEEEEEEYCDSDDEEEVNETYIEGLLDTFEKTGQKLIGDYEQEKDNEHLLELY